MPSINSRNTSMTRPGRWSFSLRLPRKGWKPLISNRKPIWPLLILHAQARCKASSIGWASPECPKVLVDTMLGQRQQHRMPKELESNQLDKRHVPEKITEPHNMHTTFVSCVAKQGIGYMNVKNHTRPVQDHTICCNAIT